MSAIPEYGILRSWLEAWKKQLEDPRRILLGVHFETVAEATLAELSRSYPMNPVQRSERKWIRELFDWLELGFKENVKVLDLIASEHPSEIADLKSLVTAGAFDTASIRDALTRIQGSPTIRSLEGEIYRTLCLDGAQGEKERPLISDILARRVLLLHDASELAKLPEARLAAAAIEIIAKKALPGLAGDIDLNRELEQLWPLGLSPEALRAHIPVRPAETSTPDRLLDSLSWSRPPSFLTTLVVGWTQILLEAKRFASDGNQATNTSVDLNSAQRLLEEVLRCFLADLTKHVHSEWASVEAKDEQSSIVLAGNLIGSHLAKHVGFVDNRGWTADAEQTTVHYLSRMTLSRVAARVFSQMALPRVDRSGLTESAIALGEVLRDSFEQYVQLRQIKWQQLTEDALLPLCRNWCAHRDTRALLERVLSDLAYQLAERIAEATDTKAAHVKHGVPADFWTEWADAFTELSVVVPSMFDFIPWGELEESEWHAVVEQLVSALVGSEVDWQVTFMVKGITPDGALWESGPVTFYDPKMYSFGSERWFARRVEDQDNLVCARVVVTADTATTAKKRARAILDVALDALSFALSINRQAGGLCPEVQIESHAIDLTTQAWTAGGGLTRHELALPVSVKQEKLSDFGQLYGPLVNRAVSLVQGAGASQPTELQLCVLRALHWYRLGRWEANPLERFLFYWIALEQVFAEGQYAKFEVLFGPLCDLTVTWQETRSVAGAISRRKQIAELIEQSEELRSRIDSEPALRDWQQDPRVLLDPSNTVFLRKCAETIETSLKNQVEAYADAIDEYGANRAAIASEVQLLRKRQKSRVHQLYRLRNQIAHEGLTYRPDLDVYTAELEQMIEKVLRRSVGDTVREVPICTTVQELVAWYQKPFV